MFGKIQHSSFPRESIFLADSELKSVKFKQTEDGNYALIVKLETCKDKFLNFLGCCAVSRTPFTINSCLVKDGNIFFKKADQINYGFLDSQLIDDIIDIGLAKINYTHQKAALRTPEAPSDVKILIEDLSVEESEGESETEQEPETQASSPQVALEEEPEIPQTPSPSPQAASKEDIQKEELQEPPVQQCQQPAIEVETASAAVVETPQQPLLPKVVKKPFTKEDIQFLIDLQSDFKRLGIQVSEEVMKLRVRAKLEALLDMLKEPRLFERYQTWMQLQHFKAIAIPYLKAQELEILDLAAKRCDGIVNWVKGNEIPIAQQNDTQWAQTKAEMLRAVNELSPLLTERCRTTFVPMGAKYGIWTNTRFARYPSYHNVLSEVVCEPNHDFIKPPQFAQISEAIEHYKGITELRNNFVNLLQKKLEDRIRSFEFDYRFTVFFSNVTRDGWEYKKQALCLHGINMLENAFATCTSEIDKHGKSPKKLELYVDNMLKLLAEMKLLAERGSHDILDKYAAMLKDMQPGYLGLKKDQMTHEALKRAHQYLIDTLGKNHLISGFAETLMTFYLTYSA